MSAPRSRRASEPTSRAGILAAGLVRIVRTPAELDATNGWWSPPERSNVYPDVRRARREGLRPGLPRWLRPPVTPAQTVARMFRESARASREAVHYVGDRRPTPVPLMSPKQLRSTLAAEYRRLSRGWDDTALDVSVDPPEPETIALEIPAAPEPAAPVPVLKSEPEPLPEPEPTPAVVEASVTPTGAVTRRPPAPEPTAAAAPTWKPRGRDRLAWVPVMQRLATMYASRRRDGDGPEAA